MKYSILKKLTRKTTEGIEKCSVLVKIEHNSKQAETYGGLHGPS